MKTMLAAASICLACCSGVLAQSSARKAVERGERTWTHVRVLADDAMEGRRAGTPGHRRAAEYVAEQFRKAGLKPGGDDGFFQPVQLEARQFIEEQSSLALMRASGLETLELGKDAIFGLRGKFEPAVDAPLVFLGYGQKLSQFGVDDLQGVDLRGKIVVAFTAAPKNVPGSAGAHFGSPAERWKVYRAAGAVGMVLVPNPFNMDLSWERIALTRFEPTLALVEPAEQQFADQKIWITFNPARLGLLLQDSGHDAAELLALLEAGAPLPRFELPARLQAKIAVRVAPMVSDNVVGVLPGSDRNLGEEHVVLSAHLDHLGIASQGEGDRLYNGAMDNAAGVAVLIDVAQSLRKSRHRGRRSITFVALTAEESGLLGSRAFVLNAQRRQMTVTADLNTDMFLPLFPLKQLIVFGLEESDLGGDVRVVAESLGIATQTDPQPLRNRFIRSDQYSFIRAGIPSLALKVGFEADSSYAQLEREWFARRYHAPADDLGQPVDLSAVGLYATLLERLALRVASRDSPPRWNPTSTFAGIRLSSRSWHSHPRTCSPDS